ncbi:longitudinals lacking protein, isoforms H/M/V isoform X7 [Scaptodrosophila lebanonensis]|uniref:Longitudinals lacking protein, isoforms H/M/V isoform X7 n=1 Tax=Drosophila lebanonensis TaxID=7225 RepID=A0A6J2UIS8_DROLE|nr:longitudinals lacking protein, isoforms H/M/V isoform X7 [Scaptodrosophila lebanonensis]
MDDDQQFCLRWNNHQSTLISVFDTLLENETLVDCTLAAEGKFLKAHKVVLSACSPYFATLLQEQYDKHPIFILKDVKYQELRAMMDYMYRGEVNISQDQLAALLKAAESLQIKGLSDNRTGNAATAPKPESHHRGKLGGAYTLEQTKRARMATGAMDAQDVSGSREGSSSPSRRRRKVRRRSIENDAHDNSNSSVLQAAVVSNQSILQQTNTGLAASAMVATQMPASSSASNVAAASQVTTQPSSLTSTNVTKKTESAKLTSTAAQGAAATAAGGVNAGQQQQQTSDAINTDNVQTGGAQGAHVGAGGDVEDMDVVAAGGAAVHTGVVVKQLSATIEKSNHKQKNKDSSVSSAGSELVIEPKAEYDEDAHDENVEDLTLDEEDMTMEELDQTAGTSQGGEGSSQAYTTWQHDRSQDELGLMAAQDAQQRDPQGRLLQQTFQQQSPQQAKFASNNTFIHKHNNVIQDNNNSPRCIEQSELTENHQHKQPQQLNELHLHYQQQQQQQQQPNAAAGHHFQAPQFDNFQFAGTGEESYTCPQCYRTYRRHGTLRRHLRQECGKGKSMVCSVCGHRTKRADHLRQHVRKKHPEIAMRSLFKRQQNHQQQRAASLAAVTSSIKSDIVDLDIEDDINELSSVAADEVDDDQQLQQSFILGVDNDDELAEEGNIDDVSLLDSTQQHSTNYYQRQLHQQALQQLQQQFQQQQQLQALAAAAAVAAVANSNGGVEGGDATPPLNC